MNEDILIKRRIRMPGLLEKITTPETAAKYIKKGMVIGASGFTRAGSAKVVPRAIARRSDARGLQLTYLTGASVGNDVDSDLVKAGALYKRSPFQTDRTMRDAINRGEVMFVDVHLSETSEKLRKKHIAPVDIAIIEAIAITEDGGIVPSASVGNSDIFAMLAKQVIVEINLNYSLEMEGAHDIFWPEHWPQYPHGAPIGIMAPDTRIGTTAINIPPEKIVAIVINNEWDTPSANLPPDADTQKIADHLVAFFKNEITEGRLEANLRPLQVGVGTIANAVTSGLKNGPFRNLTMYSEVAQDSTFELIDSGMIDFASCTSIMLTEEMGKKVFNNFSRYKDKIVIRPQSLSNHAEVVQRLGIITINAALEVDIYGQVNSTHVMGTHMMNGIGGSGDFTHNAYLSVYVTKSIARDGVISSVVPMVPHVDHNEHDVDIIVTEVGLADLRGLAPRERAQVIINNCVEGQYKSMLQEYVAEANERGGQTPHVIEKALSWHHRLYETGSMLPMEQKKIHAV